MEQQKDEKIIFCKGGGCTAKLGAGILSRVLERLPKGPADENLLIGYDSKDDAAVYRISDDTAIVQTLDFFPPMVDDPYTFGKIAAANALSDIYAMGGQSDPAPPQPQPQLTSSALTQMFSNGNMLAYLDMMSGGALSRCTLFALGVTPYINASIIVQLLTVAIPSLENIAKEPDGQQKLQQITPSRPDEGRSARPTRHSWCLPRPPAERRGAASGCWPPHYEQGRWIQGIW